jgi:hypothetical protein
LTLAIEIALPRGFLVNLKRKHFALVLTNKERVERTSWLLFLGKLKCSTGASVWSTLPLSSNKNTGLVGEDSGLKIIRKFIAVRAWLAKKSEFLLH